MKLNIQIKNRWTGSVIFELETENNTMLKTLKAAIAADSNLRDSDLRGSNLSGSNLSGSNLSGSNLRDSDLRGSNLSGSNLRDSDLRGSNLSGSDLSGSDLSGSNLRGSNLRGSNLSGSNLRGSDLSGSNLSGSNLSGSNLSGSDLSGSNLDTIKYDFLGRMLMQKHEIPALREKLIQGKIDGSCYEGSCSCFMGTIATAAHIHYEKLNLKPNASSATEKWFTGLKPGDTPENNSIASITLGWIDEFLGMIK